jgi:hypothetical protein
VSQAVVRESQKVLEEKIQIPDGPNVAPSPLEHLAAQGVVPERADSKGGPSSARMAGSFGASDASDASDAPANNTLPPAQSSAGVEPVEPVDPAEQDLVDEQLAHDSVTARQTSPPSSAPRPSDAPADPDAQP